jgi:hypothetical protein
MDRLGLEHHALNAFEPFERVPQHATDQKVFVDAIPELVSSRVYMNEKNVLGCIGGRRVEAIPWQRAEHTYSLDRPCPQVALFLEKAVVR